MVVMRYWLLNRWVFVLIRFGLVMVEEFKEILLVLVNRRVCMFLIEWILLLIVSGIKICWEMVVIMLMVV